MTGDRIPNPTRYQTIQTDPERAAALTEAARELGDIAVRPIAEAGQDYLNYSDYTGYQGRVPVKPGNIGLEITANRPLKPMYDRAKEIQTQNQSKV